MRKGKIVYEKLLQQWQDTHRKQRDGIGTQSYKYIGQTNVLPDESKEEIDRKIKQVGVALVGTKNSLWTKRCL